MKIKTETVVLVAAIVAGLWYMRRNSQAAPGPAFSIGAVDFRRAAGQN